MKYSTEGRYATRPGAHVAVVGVGHLAGAVDDAAHDADAQVFQMRRARLDVGEGLFDVVERAAARGAGDVFGMREAHARGLQDRQLDFADRIFREARRADPDAVGQPVQQQGPQIGGGLHGEGLQRGILVAALHDDRFVGCRR